MNFLKGALGLRSCTSFKVFSAFTAGMIITLLTFVSIQIPWSGSLLLVSDSFLLEVQQVEFFSSSASLGLSLPLCHPQDYWKILNGFYVANPTTAIPLKWSVRRSIGICIAWCLR